MPIIVLERPVPLPARELERALSAGLPAYRWRVGDDPDAALVPLQRPNTILGMAGAEMIMMALELAERPLPLEAGAPAHQCHITLSEPSTDNGEVAKRLAVLTAAVLLDGEPGFAQIAPGGAWFHGGELAVGKQRILADPVRCRIDEFLLSHGERRPSAAPAGAAPESPLASRGVPPGSPAERMMMSDVDHSFAKILTEIGGADMARQMGYAPPPSYAEEEPRADRLPTFVLALAHPLEFDWAPMLDIGRLDPPGNWRVEPGPNGTGTLRGRGCTVTIAANPEPIPRYMCGNALARSFWFKGNEALRLHTSTLVMTCDLDTRAAPFEDVRETAKIMTLMLGVLTRSPGCVALLNNGIHTLLDPDLVQSQVGHLHKSQIPVMLWTWTAPDSMVTDSVSMSTGGLLPFLGYEVEVWNAPGEPDWVADKLSQVINYLLHVGPTVKDGDSFGESKGDRSIRGFFGTTNAQRHDPNVKALLLEFNGPRDAAARPDPLPDSSLPPPAPAARNPADLISIVALTKPTVFPSNIIREQLDRVFPDMRWTVEVGKDGEPHNISGSGADGKVEAFVAAYGFTVPRDLMPPPHRLHLAVFTGSHGDLALARRVALVLCSCLIISLDGQAHFQLSADGNWLSHDDALTGVSVPRHTRDIGDFDKVFGHPPSSFAGAVMPPDAYPPAPDEMFDDYRRIAAHGGPAPDPSPPAPQPQQPQAGLFRRSPGSFGRRKT